MTSNAKASTTMKTRFNGKEDTKGWLVIADPNHLYLPSSGGRTSDRIQFSYLQDNFTESKAANYSATQVLGRSEPIRGYLGSTARALNLQLMIPVEGDRPPTQVGTSSSMETVFKRKSEVVDFIRSLVYPHYSAETQNMTYPPPRVLVIFGSWFSMLGIVTNYSMTHRSPWASQGNMMPYVTEVTLTIEECDEPYSFRDVYGGTLKTGGYDHSGVSRPTSV